MTDDELIRRVQAGDREATRELHARHARRVHAVVRRIAGEDEAARDCAQEAWIRVFRGLEDFRGEAAFGSWVHRVAVNAALDWLRREGGRRAREEPLPEVLPVRERSRDVLLAARVEAALDRVPDRQRTVLVLHDVEGWTHAEIARVLEVAPGTSKSQLHRARARMRTLLAGVSELEELAPAGSLPSPARPPGEPPTRPRP